MDHYSSLSGKNAFYQWIYFILFFVVVVQVVHSAHSLIMNHDLYLLIIFHGNFIWSVSQASVKFKSNCIVFHVPL